MDVHVLHGPVHVPQYHRCRVEVFCIPYTIAALYSLPPSHYPPSPLRRPLTRARRPGHGSRCRGYDNFRHGDEGGHGTGGRLMGTGSGERGRFANPPIHWFVFFIVWPSVKNRLCRIFAPAVKVPFFLPRNRELVFHHPRDDGEKVEWFVVSPAAPPASFGRQVPVCFRCFCFVCRTMFTSASSLSSRRALW